MKAVLMAFSPKECEKIFSGEKTIEVRKVAPKLETPFKVYVYCTKERMTRIPSMYAYLHKNEPRACAEYGTIETWGKIGDVIVNPHLASKHVSFGMHGKVIGEFVCDKVDQIIEATAGICFADKDFNILDGENELKKTCLSVDELANYLGEDKNGLCKNGYAWHISDLKIYDKPKELGEFRKVCLNGKCSDCIYEECKITRPPQSWCYVEELQ